MASKSRSKPTKPMRGAASGPAFSDKTRQSIAPPKPAADIPRPLSELPPEAMETPETAPPHRIGETPCRAPAIALKAGAVGIAPAVNRPSEKAKKSKPKGR
jgi:hypothetical protein